MTGEESYPEFDDANLKGTLWTYEECVMEFLLFSY